ncbi:MAG: hypothetical protein AB7G93_20685 [Bdellovibrionales bacterium]
MLETAPLSSSTYDFLSTQFDLWVFPPPRQSKWFARMDWYLNWQMCRGLDYRGLHLPAEVYRVAQEYGVNVPAHPRSPESVLLVRGEGLVPAQACMVVECSNGMREWLNKVQYIATDLQAKKILVFLPLNTNPEEARSYWDQLSSSDIAADFVPDVEET